MTDYWYENILYSLLSLEYSCNDQIKSGFTCFFKTSIETYSLTKNAQSHKSEKFCLITFIWLLYSSVHSEPVVCEICGSTRKSQTTLLGHMRRAHPPPEVAFKCGVCNKYDLISYFAVNQKKNNNKINLLPIDRHLWFVVKFLFWDFWYHKCF